MKDIPFVGALVGHPVEINLLSTPPRPFDVRVSALSDGYAASIRAAVNRRALDACLWEGEWWVCQSDLTELAGPGSDTLDPEGGCYVPTHARIVHEDFEHPRPG